MVIDLFAYADESGIQDGATHCVVSGYIGSPRQWKILIRDWSDVLQQHGISEFHASPFFARKRVPRKKNPYRDWSDQQAEQFLDKLISVINQRHLYPIGGAVDITAFNSFTVGERRFLTFGVFKNSKWKSSGAPSRPYQLAFGTLLLEACEKASNSAKVHFVFDQSKESPLAIQTFNQIKDGQRHKVWEHLGSVTFADRRQTIGLQAADLLTHCWYAFWLYGYKLDQERAMAMEKLTQKRDQMKQWNQWRMEELLAKAPSEERAQWKAEQ